MSSSHSILLDKLFWLDVQVCVCEWNQQEEPRKAALCNAVGCQVERVWIVLQAQEWAGIASVGKRQKWADQLWMGRTFLFSIFFFFFFISQMQPTLCVMFLRLSSIWRKKSVINAMKIPSAIAFSQTINNWLWWYFHLHIPLAVVYLTDLHRRILFFPPPLSGLSSSSQLSCKWVKLCGHFELKCSGISSMDSQWTAGLSATVCVQEQCTQLGLEMMDVAPRTTGGTSMCFKAP